MLAQESLDRGQKSYVVVGIPACQVGPKDKVVPILLEHGRRLSKVLPLKRDLADAEVIFREGHDAGTKLALLMPLVRLYADLIGQVTHVFSQQIGRSIVILEKSHISALTTKGPEASAIGIGAAHAIARSDSNAGILVVFAINMHVQDVLASFIVVDDLGPLDNAFRAKVACFGGAREESAFILPLDEILGRIAVDVLEVSTVRLVFADHIISSVDLTIKL